MRLLNYSLLHTTCVCINYGDNPKKNVWDIDTWLIFAQVLSKSGVIVKISFQFHLKLNFLPFQIQSLGKKFLVFFSLSSIIWSFDLNTTDDRLG